MDGQRVRLPAIAESIQATAAALKDALITCWLILLTNMPLGDLGDTGASLIRPKDVLWAGMSR